MRLFVTVGAAAANMLQARGAVGTGTAKTLLLLVKLSFWQMGFLRQNSVTVAKICVREYFRSLHFK